MSKQHTSVRAYGILVHEGRVLLVRSSSPQINPPLWWLPGGGIDFAESPEDTVLREFHEETGLAIKDPVLHEVASDVRRRPNGDRIHTVRIIYVVTWLGGTASMMSTAPDWSWSTRELSSATTVKTILSRYGLPGCQ